MDEWHENWQRLRTGDPAGHAFLLDRLGRSVWAYLRRMAGRDDLADELFSRTWLRVVETGHRIESPRAIRQYVLAIARRQWLDEMGHAQRDALDQAVGGETDDVEPAASISVLEALAQREDAQRLRGAVDRLPAMLREVVVLRVYGELTFSQTAAILSLPLGTVLTRMRSATHRLAKELGGPQETEQRTNVRIERSTG